MQIYLAHPVSAPTPEGVMDNLVRARQWLRWCFRLTPPGYNFVANWIPVVEVLEDSDPVDRARGVQGDLELLSRCDALWLVGGRISSGMKDEADFAQSKGLKILDLTSLGEEPIPFRPERFALSCGLCDRLAWFSIHPPSEEFGADHYCDEHMPPVPYGFRLEPL